MPLSEYESRVLDQLEHDFTITDPDLSRFLASGIVPAPSAPPRIRLRLALRRPEFGSDLLLLVIAVAFMALGAVVVGGAAAWGIPAMYAVAGVAYASGLASLVGWHRRQSRR